MSGIRLNYFISNFAYCYGLNFLGLSIALLLGVLGDFIVELFKTESASAESRREIFDRANIHPRVVSLIGHNISSKVGDDGRRTEEGTEKCCPAERSPRHYNSSVHTDVFNLGTAARQFSEQKSKVSSQVSPKRCDYTPDYITPFVFFFQHDTR